MPLKIGVGRRWNFVIYKLVEGLTLGCLNFQEVSYICLSCRKVVLISNWWTSKSKHSANATNILMKFIFTTREKVSPKSRPAIYVFPFATRCALYLLILPSGLYFILNTHLLETSFLSLHKVLRIQMLFFCKESNSDWMAFSQCKASNPLRASIYVVGSEFEKLWWNKILGCLLVFGVNFPWIVFISLLGFLMTFCVHLGFCFKLLLSYVVNISSIDWTSC